MPNVGFGGGVVERSGSWQRQADGRKMRSVVHHIDGGMVRRYGWMADEVVKRPGDEFKDFYECNQGWG
jgi:hypothetical protein